MTSLKKLERDRTLAELASVQSLIASLSDEDLMMKVDLEERVAELKKQADEFDQVEQHTASTALFFGGRPVVGQRGVESEFAGTALTKYQDLVSKLLVFEMGSLGQRGPVPNKAASTMHITNIVRGSFGFILEEMNSQGALVDTTLRQVIGNVTRLLAAYGDEDENHFQSEAEMIDERILATAGEFFNLLQESDATLRIVAGGADEAFDSAAVARAVERAKSTTITEEVETIEGHLTGALPDGHMFEFRFESGAVIRGKIDQQISSAEVAGWVVNLINVPSHARLKIRQVLKNGDLARTNYTLLGLEKSGTGEAITYQKT